MKLRTTDQIHISAVSSDTLPPRHEFEVSDALGDELLKKRPDAVEYVGPSDAPEAGENNENGDEEKAVQNAPQTKDAGAAPANKAAPAAPAKKAKAAAPANKTKPEAN